MTSGTTAPLAPNPPEVSVSYLSQQENNVIAPRFFVPPDYGLSSIESNSAELEAAQVAMILPEGGDPVLAVTTRYKDKCKLSHRFDRKAVLAYEWDRSRLAIDVDGVNWRGINDAGIKVEYKLRLQPEKTKRQRCRYASRWQGLIGSGYNEMFVRETDTVWSELKDIRKEIKRYFDDNL